jgi:uncharacterized repeat protein (TIGR01451 family)
LNNFDSDTGATDHAEGVDYTTVLTAANYNLAFGYADTSHPGIDPASVGVCTGTTAATASQCVPSIWDGTHGTTAATSFNGGTGLSGGGFPGTCGNYCFDGGAILITGVGLPPGSLSLSKTPDGGTFTSGGQLKFTMVVSSNGPGAAQNVTLSDPLPTKGGLLTWNISFPDSSLGSGNCNIDSSQTLSCSFFTLAAGETRTVVVVTQVTTPAAACDGSTINNTATVTATGLTPLTDTGSYKCNACQISATALDFNTNKVTFSLTNGNASPATLSQIALSWPSAPNGRLQKVLLGTKTVFSGPAVTSPANITTFSGTPSDRTIPAGGSATITLQFEHNVDTNDAHYAGTFTFGNCPVTIPGGCVLGYPFSSGNPLTSVVFNESGVLQQINPLIATMNGTIQVYATDEHAPLLGVRPPTVSPLPSNPGHVSSPLTGDPNAKDPSGRFIHPGLFITDVTGLSDNASHTDPNYRAGDWQFCTPGCLQNGVPPDDVFGTWKGATAGAGGTFTTDADPAAKNVWNLGPGSDTPTGGFASLDALGYGTEFRWNVNTLKTSSGVPLQSGRTYRVQAIVHDGDQNKTGGDVGQACALINLQ